LEEILAFHGGTFNGVITLSIIMQSLKRLVPVSGIFSNLKMISEIALFKVSCCGGKKDI